MAAKTCKLVSVVCINNMKVADGLGQGLKLADGLFLCNSALILKPHLAKLKSYAGEGDYGHLTAPGAVFISATEHVHMDPVEPSAAGIYLNKFLWRANLFLSDLWLIRDNAVYPDCAYVLVYGGDRLIRIAKNYLGNHYSLAGGGYGDPTLFRMEELEDHLRRVGSPPEKDHPMIKSIGSGGMHELIPNLPEHNRIDRCRSAISSARGMTFLPQKIAQYITALETLFSTSSSELTYRLSERVAFFLGETPAERRTLFERIRDAYTVRSSTVHGDTLGKKFRTVDALAALSSFCDDVLRQSLLLILSNKRLHGIFASNGKDNEQIEPFFSGLILGDPSALAMLETEPESEEA